MHFAPDTDDGLEFAVALSNTVAGATKSREDELVTTAQLAALLVQRLFAPVQARAVTEALAAAAAAAAAAPAADVPADAASATATATASATASAPEAAGGAGGIPVPDGWIRVALPVESVRHAAVDLLRLGAGAEVLGPPELRERMAATARAMVERYR